MTDDWHDAAAAAYTRRLEENQSRLIDEREAWKARAEAAEAELPTLRQALHSFKLNYALAEATRTEETTHG